MPGSLGKWLFPGQWGVLSRCKLQAEFHGTRAICTRTRRCRFICCTGCSVKAVESLHFCVMPPQKMPGIRTVKDLLGNQRFGSRPATNRTRLSRTRAQRSRSRAIATAKGWKSGLRAPTDRTHGCSRMAHINPREVRGGRRTMTTSHSMESARTGFGMCTSLVPTVAWSR